MLEFKDFKLLNNKDSPVSSIKFKFIDDELTQEMIEYMIEEIKKYEIYLGYDCKGEFNIEFKKIAEIELIITFPSRKVPDEKKELHTFVNRYVMDFSEYYSRITHYRDFENDNIAETT
jgi:hypothetical protein